MTKTVHRNCIGGSWREGADARPNINPSDTSEIVGRHAQAGAGADYHVPFSCRKSSSYGPREQGRYAVDFYTTVKTAFIAP